MTNGPIEPSADMRTYASTMYQLYVALTLEGFSAHEAMTIIGHTISGAFGGDR